MASSLLQLRIWNPKTAPDSPNESCSTKRRASSLASPPIPSPTSDSCPSFQGNGWKQEACRIFKNNRTTYKKKKGLGDWMNSIKPANEEKDHWVPDEAVSKCIACGSDFGAFNRRVDLLFLSSSFFFRLSNAKEASSKPVLQGHEDLARKLHEEPERNRKISDGSGRRMKEFACPICTVHLQLCTNHLCVLCTVARLLEETEDKVNLNVLILIKFIFSVHLLTLVKMNFA
ncbi:hypothetical protein RIF29_20511 [Crotalaria pallida]|uniref:Uncharacterized protein n=1 Tax=Crotalaria pallida TaxID=3830 RepID=A0AAN9I6E1_CROPI